MNNDFLNFDIPPLYNPYDRDEILCNLEALAISAVRIAGSDSIGFLGTEELINSDDDSDPVKTYENSYDELIEIIGGYNHFVNESKITAPQIRLVVDEDKTGLLKDGSQYPIYEIVIYSGSG
jgi:hypothetical protein